MRACTVWIPAIWLRICSARWSGVRLLRVCISSTSSWSSPAADELDRGDERRLLVEIVRQRVEAPGERTADVADVALAEDPGEDPPLVEHRREHADVHGVRAADPRVVVEEHVALADAGILAPVLHRPFDREVAERREPLNRRARHQQVGRLGEQRRVEVVHVHDHRRPRDTPDRVGVVEVDAPEPVAENLIGDRVDVEIELRVESHLGGEPELGCGRRHVRVMEPAVPGRVLQEVGIDLGPAEDSVRRARRFV